MVQINQNFKLIGLFPVTIALHPEVKVTITINIARSVEEADTQAKTGKALIAGESDRKAKPDAPEADLEGVLEEGAFEAEKQKRAEADSDAAEDAADDEAKAAKRAKKAEKAKSKKSDDAETDTVMGRENLPED
jgi:hypothetical protein